ncbi:23S rRNA (adenine(1618)-N(6))-methyltransferase RlmF [Vibrio marisflavi]|nr:23S rRNA (adenine(1618)-N(6))-methyltransferase RlmF [Vibrio marisflavi]
MSQNRKPTQPKTVAKSLPEIKITKVNSPKGLHARNKHQGRYHFPELVKVLPELKRHITTNPAGEQTINFSDPLAVKLLNKALLSRFYQVTEWDIPQGYLCPPIPGRADYIHRAAELLSKDGIDVSKVRALDIGVGANCIYPIIGVCDYDWHYTTSDVDPISIDNANQIIRSNSVLKDKVECRLQKNSRYLFQDIIQPGETYHITTCNPPFHKSLKEAQQGTQRKLNNLNANRAKRSNGLEKQQKKAPQSQPALNFGGQKAELWCPGGEAEFIKNMAIESRKFSQQVIWFTTLISKKDNVRWMQKQLKKVGVREIQIVEMSQGQKISRFVAWTFHSAQQRQRGLSKF